MPGSEAFAGARRAFPRAAALAVLVFAGACSDPLGAERDHYSTARGRWERAGIEDYVFDYQHLCFCGPEELRLVTITVRAGEVASVAYVDTGQPTERPLADFPTVDDLFEVIRDAIHRDAFSIAATYDEELGYPTGVSIDYRENVADEEMGFVVSALAPGIPDKCCLPMP